MRSKTVAYMRNYPHITLIYAFENGLMCGFICIKLAYMYQHIHTYMRIKNAYTFALSAHVKGAWKHYSLPFFLFLPSINIHT